MNRGDLYDVDLPGGRHPAVVVTRDRVIPLLRSVTVAPITSTRRGIPTEVPVGREQGLRRESVINCDNLYTVPKSLVGTQRGTLGFSATRQMDVALKIALGLD